MEIPWPEACKTAPTWPVAAAGFPPAAATNAVAEIGFLTIGDLAARLERSTVLDPRIVDCFPPWLGEASEACLARGDLAARAESGPDLRPERAASGTDALDERRFAGMAESPYPG